MIDALGFRLIDESGPLMFMNADSTDHSSMVIGKHTKPTLNHVAFEMPDLDSMMRGIGNVMGRYFIAAARKECGGRGENDKILLVFSMT